MNERSDPIDLGVWDHDDYSDSEDDQENPLEGLPAGVYRLYAERVVEKPLNVRMADYWGEWWKWNARSDQDRHSRMEELIKFFGLVERSKVPDPAEVPEDVHLWLDGHFTTGSLVRAKEWVRDALIAGAVRVEKPEVPEDVKKAATFVASRPGFFPKSLCIAKYVLEQIGDSDG